MRERSPGRSGLRGRALPRPSPRLRAIAATTAVVLSVALAQVAVMSTYTEARSLSVATIRLLVNPGTSGSLEVYVPLVDWGVRFHAVKLPVALRIDVRGIDRDAAQRVAANERVDVRQVRSEATDAIAAYLRALLVVMAIGGLLAGAVVALAVRSRAGPPVRRLLACAAASTVVGVVIAGIGLAPRGSLDDPEYFAHGADIPRALQAVEAVSRSPGNLSEELNAQLVGLARLVVAPGERFAVPDARRFVVASDVHNNALVIPSLASAAAGGPVFMVGDLTDRGSSIETAVAQRFVAAGDPFVFVSGNHDSDRLQRRLVLSGAIVLTRHGQLKADDSYGPKVVRVRGMRVAGYDDPFMRRSGRRYEPLRDITAAEQRAFQRWLRGLGRVDVVMVHEPALAETAIASLRRDPPRRPIVFLLGHTHEQALDTSRNVVALNGGTAGGGGSGNLTEDQDVGLAIATYSLSPSFRPLAVDLVTIAPGSGAATARHEPLDLSGRGTSADAD